MTYAGLTYYEVKGVEDLVTFTAAKRLNALLEVITYYYYITILTECACVSNSMLRFIIPMLRWDRIYIFVSTTPPNTLSLSLMSHRQNHSLAGNLNLTSDLAG